MNRLRSLRLIFRATSTRSFGIGWPQGATFLCRSTSRQRIAIVHKRIVYCTVTGLRVRSLWQKRPSDCSRRSLKIEQFRRDRVGFPAPCPIASAGDELLSALSPSAFRNLPSRACRIYRSPCRNAATGTRLPDRHSYRAAFRKFTEDALRFSGIVHRDAHAEPLPSGTAGRARPPVPPD